MVHHLIKHASSATRQRPTISNIKVLSFSPSKDSGTLVPGGGPGGFCSVPGGCPMTEWMCDEASAGWGWPEEDEEIQKQRRIDKVWEKIKEDKRTAI